MIQKLLIANRGEIARRIARTSRRLGIAVATVHSAADRNSMHVRDIGESILIGAAPASQSYLNAAAIIAAAKKVGADAVHPGIGFLSEDPTFAEAVEAQGLVFVGPRPETMRRFGDKWAAKHEARQAKVPVIGGSEGSSNDPDTVERLIRDELTLPVVLKAAAGGGGRGVRIVRTLDGLRGVIESAMREAQSSFGRPDLIVEQFVENARHLEVQVAGDGKGGAIHLYERECSLQRRFQKIIEEAPSANVDPGVRQRLLIDAVNLARRVDYRNVGTMEFLVSGDRHYFLECNPRLQVEHTATEEVTGLDLVEIQLHIAASGTLPLAQESVRLAGHAIQARVYAEDSAAGFMPSTGTLKEVVFPADVRVETGVESGSEITPHYDSMIAKLIAHGADRTQALDKLNAAVEQTVVFGVETNLGFLKGLFAHPVVRAGTADNRFIDREFTKVDSAKAASNDAVATAAAIMLRNWSRNAGALGLWSGADQLLGWQYASSSDATSTVPAFILAAADGTEWPILIRRTGEDGIHLSVGGHPVLVCLMDTAQAGRYQVDIDDRSFGVSVSSAGDQVQVQAAFGSVRFTIKPYLSLEAGAGAQGGQVLAPMMGVVTKVKVKAGETVKKGDVVVVQESMKMELSIEATCAGTVSAVNCAEGDMVERHKLLVEIKPE